MEATITTLGDVFKKKATDVIDEVAIKSYDAPTIWIDGITGEEHEDHEHTYIESQNPESPKWEGKKEDPFYIRVGEIKSILDNEPDTLVVNGPIKQIGSHVIYCGPLFYGSLFNKPNKIYPFANNLYDVIKYARNLEYLVHTFEQIKTDGAFTIPEKLFWNCPKLKEMFAPFSGTNLKNIPPRLLERCTELEDVSLLFYGTQVEEIPENLFMNNMKITVFTSAFSRTNVKKVPDKLLEPFKDEILHDMISVFEFVEHTPIEIAIESNADSNNIDKELSKYLPSYFPREVQLEMIGF